MQDGDEQNSRFRMRTKIYLDPPDRTVNLLAGEI